MLSTYNDACWLNESMAFYMSTNYFRNPIFEERNSSDYYGSEQGTEDDHQLDREIGDKNSSIQHEGEIIKHRKASTNRKKRSKEHQVTSSSNKKVQLYLENKRQRLSQLCDNLKLNFMGKWFVMELNFKRRLGMMRSYLDRTMPWILPSSAKREGSGHSMNDKDVNSNPFSRSSSIEDEYLDSKSFWSDLKPPRSRECLGEQQEKILYRLALFKKVSQKLFSVDDNDDDDEDFEDNAEVDDEDFEDDSQQEYDSNEGGFISFGNESICSDYSLAGQQQTSSKQLHYASSDSTTMSDSLGEQGDIIHNQYTAAPLANGESIFSGLDGLGAQQAMATRVHCSSVTSLGVEATRPKTTKTPLTSSSSSSTSRGDTGKSKSRFMTSRKHIRDAARALARPKKPKKLCIVCYQNAPNIITLPCNHHDICSDCFIEIIYVSVKSSRYPLKCVLCRQKIEKIRCSRKLLLSVIDRNRSGARIGRK